MKSPGNGGVVLREPTLLARSKELAKYLRELSVNQLAAVMKISEPLAVKTRSISEDWSAAPERQSPAIFSFIGDIYSGLRAGELSAADLEYADEHLRILSGLYGVLRPLDGIMPYRLEMGYKLPDARFNNLYRYWGESIVATLPDDEIIINTSAVEYSKVITDFVDPARIITPRFLTRNPRTGEPTFVVVHAKIARGAFARWLIIKRVSSVADLPAFDDLGYRFNAELSTPAEPVFICDQFQGLGLSVRLG
jgi:cytoplasmic iron level regulating protein YaaA (DUF328/UPF0246 family)